MNILLGTMLGLVMVFLVVITRIAIKEKQRQIWVVAGVVALLGVVLAISMGVVE